MGIFSNLFGGCCKRDEDMQESIKSYKNGRNDKQNNKIKKKKGNLIKSIASNVEKDIDNDDKTDLKISKS